MNKFAYQDNKKSKNYFEGWYYKNVTKDKDTVLSIIPGISRNEQNEHAFIQVIENVNHKSYYIPFSMDEVNILSNPDGIQIGENYFYDDNIYLNIISGNLCLSGFLQYNDLTPIQSSLYSPTIMGPFSYLPFMECNHSIISMHHSIDGLLKLNDEILDFNDGIGYSEKDYGISFPKEYLWLQSNHVENDDQNLNKISLFYSEAEIPFKLWNFKGFISVFHLNDKEYRFATYNGAKLNRLSKDNGNEYITLKRGNYKLELEAIPKHAMQLKAPLLGVMKEDIYESIDSDCMVTFYEKEKIKFKQKLIFVGYEKK